MLKLVCGDFRLELIALDIDMAQRVLYGFPIYVNIWLIFRAHKKSYDF